MTRTSVPMIAFLVAATSLLGGARADCENHVWHCGLVPNLGPITATASIDVGGSSEGNYVNVTTNNTAATQGNVTVNVTVPPDYSADSADVSAEVASADLDFAGDETASKTVAKGETATFVFPFEISETGADIPILVTVTVPEGVGTTTLTIHFLKAPEPGGWLRALPGPGPWLVLAAAGLLALGLRKRA